MCLIVKSNNRTRVSSGLRPHFRDVIRDEGKAIMQAIVFLGRKYFYLTKLQLVPKFKRINSGV
ncbi:Uncharacterised protein [Legionella spiritensis]|nr:Uncharacterised protein [Legionella spiritensis]